MGQKQGRVQFKEQVTKISIPTSRGEVNEDEPEEHFQLKPKQYSTEQSEWVDAKLSKDVPIATKELKIVTYNVWFEHVFMQERYTAILDILGSLNADVSFLPAEL